MCRWRNLLLLTVSCGLWCDLWLILVLHCTQHKKTIQTTLLVAWCGHLDLDCDVLTKSPKRKERRAFASPSFVNQMHLVCWPLGHKVGGSMVKGLVFTPCCLVSLDITNYSTFPHSIQVNGSQQECWGIPYDRLLSSPGGIVNVLSYFRLQEPHRSTIFWIGSKTYIELCLSVFYCFIGKYYNLE